METTNTEKILFNLALMNPLEYEHIRKKEAKRLGVRVNVLDEEVAKLRGPTKNDQETKDDSEPWEEPVDGGELADLIYKDITTHIILPESSAIAISLWVLLTYVFDAFRILPILAILSPEKRCGKTTLLSLLNGLVNNGMMASNVSSAVVYRVVEKYKPTLLTDEADTFFKTNEELRGIYNSGHNREAAFVIRSDKETLDPVRFSTWAPKAIAMIGKLPDTIADRSVIVNMSRKKRGENAEKKKLTHFEDNISTRRKAKRWAEDNSEVLNRLHIDMPEHGNDRMIDNWTPLFTIAAIIGNGWQEKAIHAMGELAEIEGDDESIGSMLLEDIQEIFKEKNINRISSEDLINKLVAINDRPWPEWRRGNPLSQAGLARLLKRFSIKTKKIRFTDSTLQGYSLEQFKESFSRYIHPSQSGTPEQHCNINKLSAFQTGTNKNDVPLKKGDNLPESLPCSTVPFQKGVTGEGGKNQPQLFKGAI